VANLVWFCTVSPSFNLFSVTLSLSRRQQLTATPIVRGDAYALGSVLSTHISIFPGFSSRLLENVSFPIDVHYLLLRLFRERREERVTKMVGYRNREKDTPVLTTDRRLCK